MANQLRRKILITGGTDGIGLALAKRLAARHDVVVTGRRSARPDTLPAAIAYIAADQSDPVAARKAVIIGLEQSGWLYLDNAILNAGVGYEAKASDDSLPPLDHAQAIRQTLDVNLNANIALAHGLYPFLN
jgi:NAD(P)-dependent dehydrogenase (short-subunit alcohol dehydrogenase family)